MVNLKKYNTLLQHFVLFLTLLTFVSCGQQMIYVSKVQGKQINVNKSISEVAAIENYVKPYRDSIDKDLSEVLAFAPQTIDKSGQWQTPMGNLLSDVTLELGNPVFNSREKKAIDVCLLNHGGIRTIISKGDITARTAFEVMPFENSLVIVGLKGTDITTIASYIIKEKKPHPLAGMTFTIGKDNLPKDILVQGKPVDPNKIYYVGTSDYLSNGGDNMSFFKNGVERYDLNYKLRNVLIDYFKKVETIPLINNVRISVE